MSSYSTPGVYMVERPDTTRLISGVSTSTAAFIGPAIQGPLTPRTIFSWEDFKRIYGGLWKKSDMTFAVYQFFLNGGSEAIVIRVFQKKRTSDDGNPPNIQEVSGKAVFFGFVPENSDTNNQTINTSFDNKFETKHPGGFSKNYEIEINKNDLTGEDLTNNFNLVLKNKVDGEYIVLESHYNMSLNEIDKRYFETIIDQDSKYLQTIKSENTESVSLANPIPFHLKAGNMDGTQGVPNDGVLDDNVQNIDNEPQKIDIFTITGETPSDPMAKKTGLKSLEEVEIFNLLCIPPYNKDSDVDADVYTNALQICENRNAMLIVDPKSSWKSYTEATSAVEDHQSPNVIKYFPYVIVSDPLTGTKNRRIVPCGAIAGVIARIDTERGVWKSPAGLEARLNGVHDLDIHLTAEEQGKLNVKGINALALKPLTGPVIWGARTTKGIDVKPDPWKYVSVRRTFLFIKESVLRGSQWIVFEPNDYRLWAQIRLSINSFLNTLFRKGAFAGSSPKEAYFVKCDSETTTQSDILAGVVNVVLGFAPLRPAEFVVITMTLLNQQTEGGS